MVNGSLALLSRGDSKNESIKGLTGIFKEVWNEIILNLKVVCLLFHIMGPLPFKYEIKSMKSKGFWILFREFLPAIISKSNFFPVIISENHNWFQRIEIEYQNPVAWFHFLVYHPYILAKNVCDAGNDFLFSADLFQIILNIMKWNLTNKRSIQHISSKYFWQRGTSWPMQE